MLIRRLFQRVAAVFPKHLLPYTTARVCGTVSSVLEEVDDKPQQVALITDGQSREGLYMYKPVT